MSPEMSKICPKCGTQNPASFSFCLECLAVIGKLSLSTAPYPYRILPVSPTGEITCPYCKRQTPARFQFCIWCLGVPDGRFRKGCPTCGKAMERNVCSDPACQAAAAVKK